MIKIIQYLLTLLLFYIFYRGFMYLFGNYMPVSKLWSVVVFFVLLIVFIPLSNITTHKLLNYIKNKYEPPSKS